MLVIESILQSEISPETLNDRSDVITVRASKQWKSYSRLCEFLHGKVHTVRQFDYVDIQNAFSSFSIFENIFSRRDRQHLNIVFGN